MAGRGYWDTAAWLKEMRSRERAHGTKGTRSTHV
jgi:hypothetical protein